MPAGSRMSKKPKVMPLNLSPRAAKWTPHSTIKSHDNPWARRMSKPLRCNQPLMVSPVFLVSVLTISPT